MPRRLKGAPPRVLTGQLPVSAEVSPWWDSVVKQIASRGDLLGRAMTIEEVAALVPSYPDGRRPRQRAVARRLRPILQLVERGPNGSLGRGATYFIVAPPSAVVATTRDDIDDDVIEADGAWLNDAVRRMTDDGS